MMLLSIMRARSLTGAVRLQARMIYVRRAFMNIGENYYCSRCFLPLADEGICPACGYDPEHPAAFHALEEGTLLGGGRYQIGAVITQTDQAVIYGAWDHRTSKPVFVKEFFPKEMAKRDCRVKDTITVKREEKQSYDTGLNLFLKSKGIRKIWPESGIAGETGMVTDSFEKNRTGYLVLTPVPIPGTEAGGKFLHKDTIQN